MEGDDFPSYKPSEAKVGLHKDLSHNSSKPRAKKMEGEGKKFGTKDRSKPIEIGIDSDDDEPIRSLLKLKRTRNPKKVKVVLDKAEAREEKLLVGDEDFGGMDDTLASFRKRLKGPKKDIGSVSANPLEDNVGKGYSETGDALQVAIDKGIAELKRKERLKKTKIDGKQERSKASSAVNDISENLESQGGDQKDDQSLLGDKVEDSVSNIFHKVQSSPVRKSRMNSFSKQNSRALSLVDRPSSTSNGSLEVSKSVAVKVRSTASALNVVCKDLKVEDDSNLYTGASLKDSASGHSKAVENQSFDSGFPPASDCMEGNCDENTKSGHKGIDKSSEENQDERMLDSHVSDIKEPVVDPCVSRRVSEEICSTSTQGDRDSLETQALKNGLKACSLVQASTVLHDGMKVHTSASVQQEDIDGFCKLSFDKVSREALEKQSKDVSMSPRNANVATSDGKLPSINVMSSEVHKAASNFHMNHQGNCLETFAHLNESSISIKHANLPAYDTTEGTCILNHDNIPMNGEANVASPPVTPEENESSPEDTASIPDSEIKDDKLSAGQRGARKTKRNKLGDMAYEGDPDWEILINDLHYSENEQAMDSDKSFRMKEKSDSSSISVEAENGGVAAVSVGLKARAAGPVEKIKFKEVLKRKGGLQEYLECRNQILGFWSKDVSRILPLADCGITDAPSVDESPRASLIREVYAFLDQSGYINVGIALEKEKAEPSVKHNYKLLEEKTFEVNPATSVADLEDGVSFILGRAKSSETSFEANNGVSIDDDNPAPKATKSMEVVTSSKLEVSNETECTEGHFQQTDITNAKISSEVINEDYAHVDIRCAMLDGGMEVITSELKKELRSVQSSSCDHTVESHESLFDSGNRKKIIVVGAGPAGLTAARHLQRQGFCVTLLEGRGRIGGRVYTDHSSLSVPVDLGASIITGVEADVATERRPDPSSLICAQLGLELTVLNSDCPLYDIVTREKVPPDLDEALEAEYNSLLDDMVLFVAKKGEHAMKMSLEDGLEYALKSRRVARMGTDFEMESDAVDNLYGTKTCIAEGQVLEKNCSKEEILSPLERRVMDWHFAHLEYGCAALLKEVSLPYWNQDDVYGGFGGAHCMIKGGYSNVVESLSKGLHIHLNHVVTDISYWTKETGMSEKQYNKVKVSTSNGMEFLGAAVLITVPLGCLKADTIRFDPPLPKWKRSSIQRLGFGVLNKVVLEFPEVFWDDSVDYFGATAEETDRRGHCFMFWNVRKTVGAPVLIALVVGKAAVDGQNMSSPDHVSHALMVLRKLFGEAAVPDPVASVVTDWGRDPFSYGAYSYVAIGSSGEDYDILGRPVENLLFFAGEATCKEHPDTVGGAMMSGLREAVRIVDILNTGNDYTAEVEAMEAAQRHSDSERYEVRDITKRLEAVELSNVLYKNSLDGDRILTREALLKEMFFNAKTTVGRLHLAKKLLSLPVETLKSFAGTRKGLTMLNSWILDSMGKDGTQLLRHCVRLLVRVSTNLLAVRLSGIGKTVKEKVCVHTSRDIRAIASQLVSVWLEVFRKEKASNGGLKLLRQATQADFSKRKSVNSTASGKPPLRTHNGGLESKWNLEVPRSTGSHLPSNSGMKKMNGKAVKVESLRDSKLETMSNASLSKQDTEAEEDDNYAMSEEELAALAAAEAAQAAARAAAEAYASAEARSNNIMQLPKIPSFHKFAKREQYAQMDEFDLRRKWSGGILGRQDCISEIDSRNCRVRDWSVDLSAACANFDTSRISADNVSQRSHSNEIACHMNLKEQSGENAAVDSSLFTGAWVDTAGSEGIKDYHAIDRWQSQAAAADSEFFHPDMHIKDEEDSNTSSKPPTWENNGRTNESSISQVTSNKDLQKNHLRGADRIKQAVVDFVASLLMPVYKARKIDRDGYKSIMKKTATKVMEQATDSEKAMAVSEFLDSKRKNKIRAFVDRLIERHMAMKPTVKP